MLGRIEPRQHLALRHGVAFLHQHLHHLTGHLGAHQRHMRRAQLPGKR